MERNLFISLSKMMDIFVVRDTIQKQNTQLIEQRIEQI